MRIDAHQHFWRYDRVRDAWITDLMNVLKRDFLPEDLHPLLMANQFNGCIAVQADQSEEETQFLLDLAKQHAFIKGVVGWVDLRSDTLQQRLLYYRQFSKLKGFRHIVQAEPKGFLTDPQFINGVRLLAEMDYTYDLLIYHHQLEEALVFVEQLPDVKLIVDHLAKPDIRNGALQVWERRMTQLAKFSNVYCKVSGIVTEADWSRWRAEDFHPYLDVVFEAFGAGRIVYGSDWPVCLLASTYHQQLAVVVDYLQRLTPNEKNLVMGENARRFYNL